MFLSTCLPIKQRPELMMMMMMMKKMKKKRLLDVQSVMANRSKQMVHHGTMVPIGNVVPNLAVEMGTNLVSRVRGSKRTLNRE